MNDDMTEEKKDEIALAKTRVFKDGDPASVRAQMEWEEHLIKEQQRLNRNTVLFSVIISSILGMLGIIGGAFLQYHLERNREQNMLKIPQHIHTEMEATKTLETSIEKESSSLQPSKEQNKKR